MFSILKITKENLLNKRLINILLIRVQFVTITIELRQFFYLFFVGGIWIVNLYTSCDNIEKNYNE